METDDMRIVYFALMTEDRAQRRDEAFSRLNSEGTAEVAALARAGYAISDALNKRSGPDILAKALKEFDSLPLDTYWREFIESSAQTVLAAALADSGQDKADKKAFAGFGLRMMARAQNGGLSLSEFSIKQVRRLTESDDLGISALAKDIIGYNEMVTPPKFEIPRALRKRKDEGRSSNPKLNSG